MSVWIVGEWDRMLSNGPPRGSTAEIWPERWRWAFKQSRWAQQPLAKCSAWVVPEISPPQPVGVCWNILSPRLSRIKNCGKFLKQLTSIAGKHGKHRKQLEKSNWNWKEQHPLQRPECEQPTSAERLELLPQTWHWPHQASLLHRISN